MNPFIVRSLSIAAVAYLLFQLPALAQKLSHADNPIPNVQSHFARFETNQVHYLTAGEGEKALVWVHGWSGHSGFWREQIPAFRTTARLILVDLPGHGQSDKPRVNYTMDYLASGVLAVMRDAGVDKASLIGHSMGVPVICRVQAQAPERVAALVAIDGLLRRPSFTPEEAERFIEPFRKSDYRDHVTRFVHSMFPEAATFPLRDRMLTDVLATPQQVMSSAMEGMFGTNQPAWDPRNAKVPILVLNAPHPMWTPGYESYVRSLSSKTEYRVLEGVGHVLMLEKPSEFNAALLEMLQRHELIQR